jgi:hypothetical protein
VYLQVITPQTGEAFLKLRLKDQAAALKLLDDDPNLKGGFLWCVQGSVGLHFTDWVVGWVWEVRGNFHPTTPVALLLKT